LQAGDKQRVPALQVNDSLKPEYRHWAGMARNWAAMKGSHAFATAFVNTRSSVCGGYGILVAGQFATDRQRGDRA